MCKTIEEQVFNLLLKSCKEMAKTFLEPIPSWGQREDLENVF